MSLFLTVRSLSMRCTHCSVPGAQTEIYFLCPHTRCTTNNTVSIEAGNTCNPFARESNPQKRKLLRCAKFHIPSGVLNGFWQCFAFRGVRDRLARLRRLVSLDARTHIRTLFLSSLPPCIVYDWQWRDAFPKYPPSTTFITSHVCVSVCLSVWVCACKCPQSFAINLCTLLCGNERWKTGS